MNDLTPEAITRDPDCITRDITLRSGERALVRALRHDDAALLGRYFASLSDFTRSRFAPHPFTIEAARKLCSEIDYEQVIRVVAVTDSEDRPEIIAYFILRLGFNEGDGKRYKERGMPLDSATDCAIAPSVTDSRQNCGLGAVGMEYVLSLARRLGRKRVALIGGTRVSNSRAIHLYEKFGFRKVGTFGDDIESCDMILNLR